MITDTNFVPLEQHNQLTAGPAPWTETRVPAQVFHVARAVFGTTSLEDDQRVYRTLQAALMLQKPASPADFRDRVRLELAELDAKIDALAKFLPTERFSSLSADERDRMTAQLAAMQDYSGCLTERVAAFSA